MIVASPAVTPVSVRVCPLTLTVAMLVSDELALSETGSPFGSLTVTVTAVVPSTATIAFARAVMTGAALSPTWPWLLRPQQAIVPSTRSPQVCHSPATTWLKLPSGVSLTCP